MTRIAFTAALCFAAAAALRAGVGVWTATPNPGAQSVVVGPGGSVYTDWGSVVSYQVAASQDHGSSWQPSSGPGEVGASFYSTRVLAADPAGAIYAAFNSGGNANFLAQLYVSRDGGASWSQLLTDRQTQYLELRIDPFSSRTLYLLDGLDVYFHLRRSRDAGASWAAVDQSMGTPPGMASVLTAIAFDPQTPGRMYAAAVLFESVPLGPATAVLFASGDAGTTWTRSAANLPDAFSTLVVDPFQPSTIIGGAASGIFRSRDEGQNFVSVSAISATRIVADPLHPGRLYAATPANGVLASADGGATWSPLNAGLTNLAVSAIALDASGGYLYAATYSGVFVYRFPDAGVLVLDAAHPFSVTLSATDQRTGRTGAGVATAVNDLWGWFSIPAITLNPSNPEVFVKLLDGTAINGAYWFFYGGLTDLEYTLTVTDDTTGAAKTYTKPAGSECGGSDTEAFGP